MRPAARAVLPWAALVVHTGHGEISVAPSATPGGLAWLHQA